jgi:hypothetical protein
MKTDGRGPPTTSVRSASFLFWIFNDDKVIHFSHPTMGANLVILWLTCSTPCILIDEGPAATLLTNGQVASAKLVLKRWKSMGDGAVSAATSRWLFCILHRPFETALLSRATVCNGGAGGAALGGISFLSRSCPDPLDSAGGGW